MKTTHYLKWKTDPSKGEVFTPIGLVRMILNKIPDEVWTNPDSTFIDPCMGKGTFLIEIVRRLVDIYGYSEEDAKSRVFGYDIRVKYVNYLKRRGYKNVFHEDSLKEVFKMKFDVVLGNPPYQKKVGPNKTEAIWPKFVQKSFEICKDGGYISLIHPGGWRNVDGKFKETQKLLLSKDVKYLGMFDISDGIKMFGVETNFDIYLVSNKDCSNNCTDVRLNNGDNVKLNISNLEFIPSNNIRLFNYLVAKEGEETVDVLYSRSAYGTDKRHMSKVRTEEHIYTVITVVRKNGDVDYTYSSKPIDNYFNKPKIVWSNTRITSLGVYIDHQGEYPLTQFNYGISDEPENLPLISKVLTSSVFINIMKGCINGSFPSLNYKILSTFRKDFWKEFLDEDGNIIEPNFNQNVEQL
jgi:hypothetical protein